MIAISIQFLAGRYHATPWGRHVNEGAVEWPPSPWRILRALVATWKRTLPDLPESDVKPILEALAQPPEFALPPASTGHTRHYMPWDKGWKDDEQQPRTLVFDAFIALSRDGALIVRWPDTALTPAQHQILASILANLGTLGRSESWCEAALLPDAKADASLDMHDQAVPLLGGTLGADQEIVRVLCPNPDSAFADNHVVKSLPKTTGRGKNKQATEQRTSIYDPAWNLCMETLQLHKERWSDPPGSRWVQYARPRDCFKITPAVRRTRITARPLPQVVRLVFDSTVLPLVTHTLPVAEAARRALIYRLVDVRGRGRYGHEWSRERHKAGGQPVELASVLCGKDAHGQPLSGHAHAYFLPTDEDNDGRIDHLTLFARDGFTPDEMRAMDRLREIRPHGRDNASHPLRVLLLRYGRLEEYQPLPVKTSREWVSATPYIATRHAKTRGRNRIDFASPQAKIEFLMADLRSQLSAVIPNFADSADGVEIEPLLDGGWFKVADRWRPIQFKRSRSKSGDDGDQRLAGAFRIEFPGELGGPIALGYGGHFGLGLFVPQSAG